MTSEKLNQAVALIKSGNKQAAIPILKEVLQSEPNNETAWLWLYSSVDNLSQKKFCLEKALAINPNNQNARMALEKLIGKEVSSQQPAQFTQKQKGVSVSENPRQIPNTTLKPKSSNRHFWLIGGIAVVAFLCIGIVGGSWVFYKNYFLVANQAPSELMPTDIVSNENPNGEASIVTPALIPEQQATSTPVNSAPLSPPTTTPPNFDIVAISMERKDGTFVTDSFGNTTNDTSNGLDTFIFELASENYSDLYLFLDPTHDEEKLKTAEGYEYKCRRDISTNGDIKIHFPHFRWQIHVVCEVPELTTGHVLSISYTLTTVNMVGNQHFGFKEISESRVNLTKDIVFEPKSSMNTSIPRMDENKESYQPSNTVIRQLGESINYGDITVIFNYSEGKGTVNVKNNFIGGNTKVVIDGYIFFPNINILYTCPNVNCALSLDMNPAQEISQDWLTTTEIPGIVTFSQFMPNDELNSKLQSGSCVLFSYIEVSNSSTSFKNDKPELICFK